MHYSCLLLDLSVCVSVFYDIGDVVVVHLFCFLVEWHPRALHTRVKQVVQDLSNILCHLTDV
jgi:hypothetical protein